MLNASVSKVMSCTKLGKKGGAEEAKTEEDEYSKYLDRTNRQS